MLKFKQLNISVGKRGLFSVDDIELSSGIIALVGRNGAGKSTLLRTIMGLHTNYSGTILWNEKPLKNYSQKELAKEIAIVYSNSQVFGSHSGKDVLMLGRLPYQNAFAKITKEDDEKVNTIIASLQISSFVNRIYSTLSDGEKQLIMIGRALVQDTDIILLDEPNAFLDLVNRHSVMQILNKIAKTTNKLILFSTHEISFLPDLCKAVLLIESNKIKLLTSKSQFVAEIEKSFGIDTLSNYEV